MIGLFELCLLAASLMAALTWSGVVWIAPRLVWRATMAPAHRARCARALLYAPLWLPALLLASALTPGLVGGLMPSADHCFRHAGGHHHHLCLIHPPHMAEQPLFWLLPALLALIIGWRIVQHASSLARQRKLACSLLQTSRRTRLRGQDVHLLEDRRPMAFTLGLLRPRIMLSRGLCEAAGDRTLDVILAHEQGHQQRRDGLRAALDHLAAAALPASCARPLLQQIELAREQACDQIAASRCDGPLQVAQALAEVLALNLREPQVGMSIASSSLKARVAYLLQSPQQHQRAGWWPWLVGLATVCLLGALPLHAVLEDALNFVLH